VNGGRVWGMGYLPWLTSAPHDDPLIVAIREACMGGRDFTARHVLGLIEDAGHGYGDTREPYGEGMQPTPSAYGVLSRVGALCATHLDFEAADRHAAAIGGAVVGLPIVADHRLETRDPTMAQPFSHVRP
jgi:hypothetical protein